LLLKLLQGSMGLLNRFGVHAKEALGRRADHRGFACTGGYWRWLVLLPAWLLFAPSSPDPWIARMGVCCCFGFIF
jgi:hypothetical protein